MDSKSKTLCLVLITICLISPLLYACVQAEPNCSIPAIEWQNEYGNKTTGSVSNVIQTSDGGYAFLDLGSAHQFYFKPSTLYKICSNGSLEWQKILDTFTAKNVTQTSDGGFQVNGFWNTYGTTYERTSASLKTDSDGEVDWYVNYTSPVSVPFENFTRIQTSDGGFAYISGSSLIKADSSNQTQWTKELTGPRSGPYGVMLFSIVETSDGAIAILGVDAPSYAGNVFGNIYLAKTEPFLPLPSPSELPTPISTPTSKPIVTPLTNWYLVTIALSVTTALVVILLLFRRYRKTRYPV
jgi:hypothetical protein